MIEISNIDIYGWEAAVRGMRNPLNSWERSDSFQELIFFLGKEDKALMERLCKAGTDHRKFMRMITVTMDICAPLYWWKEFDTYKVGTVRNSCSTMHKITEKEFTIKDFSYEHLGRTGLELLKQTIDILNKYRNVYVNSVQKDKEDWWQIIQLLPSSYNQKATVQVNYEVLANMYGSRHNHKLDEWVDFCDELKALPYSALITGEWD